MLRIARSRLSIGVQVRAPRCGQLYSHAAEELAAINISQLHHLVTKQMTPMPQNIQMDIDDETQSPQQQQPVASNPITPSKPLNISVPVETRRSDYNVKGRRVLFPIDTENVDIKELHRNIKLAKPKYTPMVRGGNMFKVLHFKHVPYVKHKLARPPNSESSLRQLTHEQLKQSPITYFHGKTHEYRAVTDTMGYNGIQRTDDPETANLHWGLAHIEVGRHARTPLQKVHHFPGSAFLGNKALLNGVIRKKMTQHGKELYGIAPSTFLIPMEKEVFYRYASSDQGKNIQKRWIYKPATAACGNGIRIFTVDEAVQFLQRGDVDKDAVLSEYVENPLLINGRKFDLRLYVLVTSFDPLRIYLWDDGLVRFASNEYQGDNPNDRSSHLTNFALVKNEGAITPEARKNLPGNLGCKWSLKAIYEVFESQGIDTSALRTNINDVIIKAMIAAETRIIHHMKRTNTPIDGCFELFGLDILIDRRLSPRLLEVNLFPSLGGYTQLDIAVKSHLIADTFNLACIPAQKGPVYEKGSEEAELSVQRILQEYSDNKALNRSWSSEDAVLTPQLLAEYPDDFKLLYQLHFELKISSDYTMIYPPASPTLNKYYSQFFENGPRVNDRLQQQFIEMAPDERLKLLKEALLIIKHKNSQMSEDLQ